MLRAKGKLPLSPKPSALCPSLPLEVHHESRAAIQAARQARAEGKTVSTLTIHSLWPVPEQALRRALQGVTRVVVPELNFGQYRFEVERVALSLDPRPETVGINRVDGELITPEEIKESIWRNC